MRTPASFAITGLRHATARQANHYSRIIILPVVLLLLTLNLQPSTCLAQGSLTPPGAPAPTMKTLQQVEPRTDLQATPLPAGVTTDSDTHFIINSPGSYYLSANLNATKGTGIQVTVAGVTVDLNGFQIAHVTGGQWGIRIESNAHRCTIKNGSISNFGSATDTFDSNGGKFLQLTASDCGNGLTSGKSWQIDGCKAHDNGSRGIQANAGSTLTNCTAYNNGEEGFFVYDGCTLTNSTAYNNQSHGIRIVGPGCIIKDCTAGQNLQAGIAADIGTGSTITGCTVTSNSYGIYVSQRGHRVEGNVVEQNEIGLEILFEGNIIRNNVVRDNLDNYDIVGGNQIEVLLCQLPESINWPALVKLAGTLTSTSGGNGITVASDNVTIDLGGYAVVGIPGSLKGILVSGSRSNLVIRNGTVRSWGGDGIDASTSVNGQFDRLQLSNNGGRGISAGDRALVTDCTVKQNGGIGILGGIIDTISRCEAALNGGFGISVLETAQVEKCNLNNNTGGGISVVNWSVIRDNNCDFHTAAPGINVIGARNRIDGNHLTRNQSGITTTAASSNNTIIRNSASGSTGPGPLPAPNYNISGSGNDLGPVGTAASATSPWANLSF